MGNRSFRDAVKRMTKKLTGRRYAAADKEETKGLTGGD
jgi:hypothetical protein